MDKFLVNIGDFTCSLLKPIGINHVCNSYDDLWTVGVVTCIIVIGILSGIGSKIREADKEKK